MTELLAEQLVLSLKKPIFRNYEFAQIEGRVNTIQLVKPLTYMNRSGDILPSLLRRKRVGMDGLIVITDNMDLPCGRVRMKAGGSSAGHNGLKSIMANTGSGEFFRLYIGVGRPAQNSTVVDHVLGEFSEENREKVTDAIARCASVFTTLRDKSPQEVMKEINAGKN
jgi:PTH1 family peptidyl-tRNA hydrolase